MLVYSLRREFCIAQKAFALEIIYPSTTRRQLRVNDLHRHGRAIDADGEPAHRRTV
jgi:hypothetical protein